MVATNFNHCLTCSVLLLRAACLLGLLPWEFHRCNTSAQPDIVHHFSSYRKMCSLIRLHHWFICLACLAQNMSCSIHGHEDQNQKDMGPRGEQPGTVERLEDSQLPRIQGPVRPIQAHNSSWTDIRIMKNKAATESWWFPEHVNSGDIIELGEPPGTRSASPQLRQRLWG